jgi:hypothetical protein
VSGCAWAATKVGWAKFRPFARIRCACLTASATGDTVKGRAFLFASVTATARFLPSFAPSGAHVPARLDGENLRRLMCRRIGVVVIAQENLQGQQGVQSVIKNMTPASSMYRPLRISPRSDRQHHNGLETTLNQSLGKKRPLAIA